MKKYNKKDILNNVDKLYKQYCKKQKIMIGGEDFIVDRSHMNDVSYLNHDASYEYDAQYASFVPLSNMAI
jgi:hypothetical protein